MSAIQNPNHFSCMYFVGIRSNARNSALQVPSTIVRRSLCLDLHGDLHVKNSFDRENDDDDIIGPGLIHLRTRRLIPSEVRYIYIYIDLH